MRRLPPFAAFQALSGLLWLGMAGGLPAQSLPIFHSLNPLAEARSGLYFQPLVPVSAGWRFQAGVDYASLAEFGLRLSLADTSYLLDTEALRINLSASRGLGHRAFLLAEAAMGGTYNGFLDGFIDWYHGLFGIRYPERESRRHGDFGYRYRKVGGRTLTYGRNGAYLGDLRIGLGWRHGASAQTVVSLTLPTNTAGEGYARGVPSMSLLNTGRAALHPRLIYEGSANIGYTPRQGDLRSIQERLFVLGTSGLRWRTTGSLWSFANLYLHSPYYSGADARQLDRWDLSLDFGWIIRSRSGREFRFGMSEDLWPSGPAIDADFRVGYSW